jgi:hypothetical protein
MSLPNPNSQMLKEINYMFYDFVWQGPPKIKSSVLVKEYVNGGLKMIDVCAYMKSLKLSWLRRIV